MCVLNRYPLSFDLTVVRHRHSRLTRGRFLGRGVHPSQSRPSPTGLHTEGFAETLIFDSLRKIPIPETL